MKKELGLAMTINPEYAASTEMARLLRFPSAIEIDTFGRGRVELLEYKIPEDNILVGKTLIDVGRNIKSDILICAVERGEEVIIPNGSFIIQSGDIVSIVASTENAKDFFKTFYSTVLKDNVYLQMGVLTGIIRVIKAGIFSDLNNLRTYTILSDVYTDSYGLTEEEVEKSLKDYGIEAEISKVKDWYDGYKFGDSEVYNPWSILNFLQDKELRAYWVDTSGNDLINDVLKKITKDTIRALEKLFDGEGLRQNISGTSDLSKLLNENELWELLLFSGYLTIEEKIDQKNYILRLPNKEVKELFKDSFLEKYFGRGNKLSDLMEALTENKIEDYEENLQEILLTSVSYNDTKKGNEAFYHGLIMGMGLYLEGEYITKSNIESGLGRYDFLIEPKNKSKRAFIMEFKSTDSIEKLEEISKEALKQIEDKKYDISLKQNGIKEITYIGIAFCGKQIRISYR